MRPTVMAEANRVIRVVLIVLFACSVWSVEVSSDDQVPKKAQKMVDDIVKRLEKENYTVKKTVNEKNGETTISAVKSEEHILSVENKAEFVVSPDGKILLKRYSLTSPVGGGEVEEEFDTKGKVTRVSRAVTPPPKVETLSAAQMKQAVGGIPKDFEESKNQMKDKIGQGTWTRLVFTTTKLEAGGSGTQVSKTTTLTTKFQLVRPDGTSNEWEYSVPGEEKPPGKVPPRKDLLKQTEDGFPAFLRIGSLPAGTLTSEALASVIIKGGARDAKGEVLVRGIYTIAAPQPTPQDFLTKADPGWDPQKDAQPPTVLLIDPTGNFGPVMIKTGGFLMVAVDADTSSVPIDNPPVQPSDEDLKREEFTEFVKTVIARWEKELADPNTSKLRRDILESKMQNLKDFVLASPGVRDEEARGIFRLIISQVTWIEIAADLVSSAAELLGYTDVPVPTLGTTLKGLKWVAEVNKWEKTAKAVDKALKATELYEKIENLEEKAKQLKELKDTLENVGNELSSLPPSQVELAVRVDTTSQFILVLKSGVVSQDFVNAMLRDHPWRLIFSDPGAGSALTVRGEMNSLCQNKSVASCEVDYTREIEDIMPPTAGAAP